MCFGVGKRGKLTEKAPENVDLLQEPDLDTTTLASERAGADVSFWIRGCGGDPNSS